MSNISTQYYQKLKSAFFYKPTPDQDVLIQELVRYVFEEDQQDIFLLRGYAGTGKTSIISSLVKVLKSERAPVVLMAPTGRAAKVLSAYSGQRASTIHRRIYFALTNAVGNLVLRLQKNKLQKAVFIIDEASMIPDERSEEKSGGRILLDDVLEFVFSGKDCKLIMVGDVAQLPPVGLNVSPALNSIYLKNRYSNAVRKIELTQVVRQKRESGILHNATRLRNIMISKNYLQPLFELRPFKDVENITPYELLDELRSAYDIIGQDDTAIITRSNKAAYQYNMAVRNQILLREQELESGDLLMIVKNNYFWLDEQSQAGFLANGDLVEVMSIGSEEEKYNMRFVDISMRLLDYPDEEEVTVKIVMDSLQAQGPALSSEQNNHLYQSVLQSYMDIGDKAVRLEKVRNDPYFNAIQVKFAYALTCHKTQGGQWNTVFIDQGFIKEEMRDLNHLRWLYTGITRATNKLFLINFPEEFIED